MAIGTFSELKTAVANWLHRVDLTSQIPDFITMAESRLNRTLDLRIMETEAPLMCVPGSRYVPLPDDLSSPIALWLETWQPRQKLTNQLPEQMSVSTSNAGVPVAWAVDNAQIAFQRPADQAHALTFRYRKKFALSNAAPTNALLTQYPDVYLYATLLEAAPYLRDNPNIGIWQDRLTRATKEIQASDSETRALAPLTTELAAMSRGGSRFNIYEGF